MKPFDRDIVEAKFHQAGLISPATITLPCIRTAAHCRTRRNTCTAGTCPTS
jgi:hypothetical protein